MRSWGFYFNATPDALVGDGEIRFDVAPPYQGRVTRLYVDNLDRDGQYCRTAIDAYPAGTVIYLDASGTFAQLQLLGAPVRKVGYLELPVVTIDATPGGLAPGPVTAAFLVVDVADALDDPLLITLAAAKAHLYITDDDHDAEVTAAMTDASATIRDYLKGHNDPTWTDTTAPPWVQRAVKLLLAHFYENRGDAHGTTNNDPAVWAAIAKLLDRSTVPTVA